MPDDAASTARFARSAARAMQVVADAVYIHEVIDVEKNRDVVYDKGGAVLDVVVPGGDSMRQCSCVPEACGGDIK